MCALSLSFDCWVNTAVKLSLAKRRQNAFRPALRLFILRQQSTEAAMMINFNMEPQSQWPCRCFHCQLISSLLLVVSRLIQQRCWFVIILKLCAIMTQHLHFVFSCMSVCLFVSFFVASMSPATEGEVQSSWGLRKICFGNFQIYSPKMKIELFDMICVITLYCRIKQNTIS